MSLVTVVIPLRGPPAYLAEALASLLADESLIGEVVVAEDGTRFVSADDLRASFPRVRVLELPPVGRSLARNEGVRAARTPFVAFLDSDDLSLPGRLQRQLDALSAHPSAALSFGPVQAVDAKSRPLGQATALERARFGRLLERGPGYESLLRDCPIYTSATMVRRDAFLAVGGYRRELDAYEDLDLYLRLARSATLVPCAGAPLACHRRHAGNTSAYELFAGSVAVARLHLEEGPPTREARRLLLEREIDGLWGLGDAGGTRRRAWRALREDAGLLLMARFRRRLLTASAPQAVARAIRRRRA